MLCDPFPPRLREQRGQRAFALAHLSQGKVFYTTSLRLFGGPLTVFEVVTCRFEQLPRAMSGEYPNLPA